MPQPESPDFEKRLNSGEAPVSTDPEETKPTLSIEAINLEAQKAALVVQESTRQAK